MKVALLSASGGAVRKKEKVKIKKNRCKDMYSCIFLASAIKEKGKKKKITCIESPKVQSPSVCLCVQL